MLDLDDGINYKLTGQHDCQLLVPIDEVVEGDDVVSGLVLLKLDLLAEYLDLVLGDVNDHLLHALLAQEAWQVILLHAINDKDQVPILQRTWGVKSPYRVSPLAASKFEDCHFSES